MGWAAEKRNLDINDVTVTMWIMMEALFNEYYAENISRKMIDSAAKLSDEYEVQMMMELTANKIGDIQKNWVLASNSDRQAFAHSLFEEIVYDLDTRRIVSFKTKPWAGSFLQLRVALAEMYGENPASSTSEPQYTQLPPEGIEPSAHRFTLVCISTLCGLYLHPIG